MPAGTDFKVSPYNDDFQEAKNFHRILFKPTTPVQVRELNQLQTILQNQIERFGNNVYKRGTIIDGVNFQYYPDYSYVKINDNQIDGTPAFPALYVGHFAKDPTTNLVAHVINSVDGFEATDPDLKTLYLRYLNSGNTGNTVAFTANSVLTIYDYDNSIQSVTINNGASGFANSDTVVFVPAITVNTSSSNSFSNGEYIVASGKRAIITKVDTTTYAGKTVLSIKPATPDLTNNVVTSDAWTFPVGSTITGNTTGASATVTEVIGTGAQATLLADAATGKIVTINVTKRGSGYYVNPFATIKSSNRSVPNYTDLDITARNYLGRVKVANTGDAIGTGYAFGVSEGIIYQKGFFIRVTPQVAIVSKYSPLPDGLSVGFVTKEAIIDSNIDESLKDNVSGAAQGRPGADRLNLIPQLTVVDTNSVTGNSDFLSVVDFSAGQPFRQKYDTQFNAVEKELEVRMTDTSGNFVIDKFQVTTRSTISQTDEGQKFSVITDPGRAYINGKRVDTRANFLINVDKGIDYATTNNVTLSLDYGNYIVVKELGGSFQYITADTVDLYDTAKTFISNTAAATSGDTTPVGTKIGTARLRSMTYQDGTIGTSSAKYRMYLFDIEMNAGKNFKDVRSIYYNGSKKGIADIVLSVDSSVANAVNTAQLVPGSNRLLFPIVDGVKNITGLEYIYRTERDSINFANTGTITISLTANTGETFAYNAPVYGTLTTAQRQDIYFVPTGNNLISAPNGNGTISVSSGSNTVVGTGTLFSSQYQVGDFMYIYSNAASSTIGRVATIANNTQLTLDQNVAFSNGTAVYAKAYPKNVPIPIDRISTANVSVSGAGDVLTINLGFGINSTSAVVSTVGFDVLATNITPQAKTAKRDLVTKIQVANNVGGSAGPWALGVPDVFRLKHVYVANVSTVNTASKEITDEFYIDNNQNTNFLDIGYLRKKPKSRYALQSTDFMLVVFDAFTSNPGPVTLTSYVSANLATRLATDSLSLTGLGSNVNSFEVPEVYGQNGDYYDLLDCLDFRPVAANTIPLTNSVAAAVINPPISLSFGNTADPANDRKFPLPQTSAQFNLEQFLGRKDLVVVTDDSTISVLKGSPGVAGHYASQTPPANALQINSLAIPPYPNLPKTLSSNTSTIVHTGIASERYAYGRILNRTINTTFSNNDILTNQPVNYTMADIGKLERRISDLEMQVNLNALESAAKDLVIPSSVDPSISRFKYGFYVDSFDNGQFSDVHDPEFHAEFMNGKAVPPSSVTLFVHGDDTYITNPAARQYTLINQPDATVGATSNTTSATGVVTQVLERQQQDTTVLGGAILGGSHYPDKVTVNMSTSVNGVQTVTMYLYNYSSGDRIQIFKGTDTSGTPLTSTTDAVALTQSDINYMKTQPFFASVSANLTTTLRKRTIIHPYQIGWDVLYGAKIVFQHNPADGNVYTIVTEKGPQSDLWRWQLVYPVDASAVSPMNVPTPQPAVGPDPAIYSDYPYTRVFFDDTAPFTEPRIIDPVMNGPTLYAGAVTVSGVLSRDGSVTITARGLKPLTDHLLIIDPTGNAGADTNVQNLNLSDHCSSVANPTKPLMTDAQGKVTFTLNSNLIRNVWGQPSIADASLFDKLKAMSYPGLSKLPLLLNGGQNLNVAPGYIFGNSFVYFNLSWLDYEQSVASYIDTSNPPPADTPTVVTPPPVSTPTPVSAPTPVVPAVIAPTIEITNYYHDASGLGALTNGLTQIP